MKIPSIFGCLFVGLSAAALTAQERPPVFTATANVARLDVQVVDASGRPIPDLRADEVHVIEGGSKRPVLLIQHIAEAGRTYAESAMRTIASEVSTNQGAPRGQLYVLLFDQEHITAGAEQKVRLAAERFIKEKIQPQDRVAVYGVPSPGPSLSFTNNTRAAIDQLQSVRGGMNRMNASMQIEMTDYEAFAIQRGSEAVMNRFLFLSAEGTTSRTSALVDAIANSRRAGESQDALRRLVLENAKIVATRADGDSRRFLQTTAELLRGLRNVDGRKNILLFSEGFFGDNLALELRNVASAAAEVYGVVYTFDLNNRVTNMTDEPSGNDAAAEALARVESIGGLAADTNGALIPDAMSHLDDALGKLATPSNDYYIVGFEPSPEALADRTGYRKIEVKVTRPGATVRTRTGYTAGADARASSLPSLRRLTIDNALAAPFGHQGLHVEYTTYQTRGSGGAERIVLSLEAELPVADGPERGTLDEGRGTAAADVVFVVRNARTGALAASGADTIALPTRPVPGRASGVSPWRVQFTLPPGEYLMRCIVREPGGLLGSADRQFAVRSLGGPDVSASDLLLGKPGAQLPVRASAYTKEPLPGAIRIYGRAPEQLDKVTARLELIATGGNAPAIGVTGVPADTRDVDGQVLRDIFFEVPLAGVPPGDYVARAEIRAGGELVSELRRQVTVMEGSAPAGIVSAPPRAEPSEAASSEIARLIDPSDKSALDGVSFLKSAKYPEAVAALGVSFDANPKKAPVAFMLGWAHRGTGNLTAAVSAFRNAALADPSMIPAHLALADTYLELKQPALAVQALEAGLASQPNAVELKRMLEAIKK
ncbi:MAG: VWA domain-containing protein [Acidobacteria bacterium]|nr:MAG: VWA domain-containing protein [Acidobacteriota bacterium]